MRTQNSTEFDARNREHFARTPLALAIGKVLVVSSLYTCPFIVTGATSDLMFQNSAVFTGVDAGTSNHADFIDIDNDNDLDIFVGEWYGTVHYFENTGTSLSENFESRTGADNPLDLVNGGVCCVDWRIAPTFVDIDNDGDYDVFIGEKSGTLLYYENTGSAQNPNYVKRSGAANPFNGVDVGDYADPAFVDIDGDGDLDAFVGEQFGSIKFYRNTGTKNAATFVLISGASDPLDGELITSGYPSPHFVDIDSDNDADLFVASKNGSVSYYENTGDGSNFIATQRLGTDNPLSDFSVIDRAKISFGDIDGDGDFDVALSADTGEVVKITNIGNVNSPVFYNPNPLLGKNADRQAITRLVDIDGDGDLDLFSGGADGTLRYFRNDGTTQIPLFTQLTGASNPFDGVNVGNYGAVDFSDIDGDGDLDALLGDNSGIIHYFNNTGGPSNPIFSELTGVQNPFNGVDVGMRSVPACQDMDKDGDIDCFIGESNGTFLYYENTGDANNAIFTHRTGAQHPLDAVDIGTRSKPYLSDIDHDGDFDLWSGSSLSGIALFENTGTSQAPSFTQRTGADNPLESLSTGANAAVSFGDLDGDLDEEAIISDSSAALHYYANITAQVDLSVTQTQVTNPAYLQSTLRYEIQVANTGTHPATNVVFIDTLPASVTYISASASDGSNCSHTNGTLTCNLDNIASQSSTLITLDVIPNDTLAKTNAASVSAYEFDPVLINDSYTSVTEVSPTVDLSISVANLPESVNVGDSYSYSLQVENLGPSDASNVSLTESLPATLLLTATESTLGECSLSTNLLTCPLGSLTSGQSSTVTVTVSSIADGTALHTATVNADQADLTTSNDQTGASVTIHPVADLSLLIGMETVIVNAGTTYTYAFVIQNEGPSAATDTQFTTTVPSDLVVSAISSDQGNCAQTGLDINCNLGLIENNATTEVRISTSTKIPGNRRFTAAVVSSTAEPSSDNNVVAVLTTTKDATDTHGAAVQKSNERTGGGGSVQPAWLALWMLITVYFRSKTKRRIQY